MYFDPFHSIALRHYILDVQCFVGWAESMHLDPFHPLPWDTRSGMTSLSRMIGVHALWSISTSSSGTLSCMSSLSVCFDELKDLINVLTNQTFYRWRRTGGVGKRNVGSGRWSSTNCGPRRKPCNIGKTRYKRLIIQNSSIRDAALDMIRDIKRFLPIVDFFMYYKL